MRSRFIVFAVAVIGIAGVGAANAADGPVRHGLVHGPYSPYGVRSGAVIVYDNQPGVLVRAYWYPPWNNRHYFPSEGRRPRVGRLEHMPARRLTMAEDYFRYWSTSSIMIPETPRYRPRNFAPPSAEPLPPLPPLPPAQPLPPLPPPRQP